LLREARADASREVGILHRCAICHTGEINRTRLCWARTASSAGCRFPEDDDPGIDYALRNLGRVADQEN
jgi:hypothetical protein